MTEQIKIDGNITKKKRVSNLEWSRRFESVNKEWLSFMEPSRARASSILRGWHEWISENVSEVRGMTPDEMVKYQQRANESKGIDAATIFQTLKLLKEVHPDLELTVDKLMEVQEEAEKNGERMNKYAVIDGTARYILEHNKEWRLTYQKKNLSTVRSFFEANNAKLPITQKSKKAIKLTVPPAEEDLTLEDVKQVVQASNEMFRAIFLCMIEGGMGLDELLKWNKQGIEKLEEDLSEPIKVGRYELVKINFMERKGNKQPYWTLIGGDALEALKTYLKVRARRKESFEKRTGRSFPDAAFVTNVYTALQSDQTIRNYWLRKMDRLGIIKREKGAPRGKRYGKNIHQVRDLFRSQWSLSKADGDVGEFLMGHMIDPLGYNKFYKDERGERFIAEEYAQALPYLNIESSARAFGLRPEREIEDAVADATKELRDQVADLKNMVVKETIPSQAQRIEKMERASAKALKTALQTANYYIAVAKREGDTEKVAILKAERALHFPDTPEST